MLNKSGQCSNGFQVGSDLLVLLTGLHSGVQVVNLRGTAE